MSINWQTLERLRRVFLETTNDTRMIRRGSPEPDPVKLAGAAGRSGGRQSGGARLRGAGASSSPRSSAAVSPEHPRSSKSVSPPADYWQSLADLADYDATFAQRIGWKWDHVLAELRARGWQPPGGTLLDWGCGSGIAARAFLDWFEVSAVGQVAFWDRSSLAMSFAVEKARAKYAGLPVSSGLPARASLVLVSHVLTELADSALNALLDQLTGATAVLWVEPGTWEASRRLITMRERLRAQFNLVAPCTHGVGCGLLAPGNERHWCHHFRTPPDGVFSDPFWGRFAQMTGVDLRSLPLSYLVLDRRPVPPLPKGTVRVLGRPRVYKTHAAVHACAAEGVAEVEIRRRELPEVVARLDSGAWSPLQQWTCEGGRAVSVTNLLPARDSS